MLFRSGTATRLTVPFEQDTYSGEVGVRGKFVTGPVNHTVNLSWSGLEQKKATAFEFSSAFATNLYNILDARPGVGKDTAMNVCRNLLNKVPTIKTQSDSITKEEIYVRMENNQWISRLRCQSNRRC